MNDEQRQTTLAELRRSAESGNLEDLHLLLEELMDGGELTQFKPDYILARHYAHVGVEKGSNPARLVLARIFQNGYNGEPDHDKADMLYQSLIGTDLEMQAAFYRKNEYACAADYLDYLARCTAKS